MPIRFVSIGLLLTIACAAQGTPLLQKRSSRPLQAEAAPEALEPWETPISGFFIRSHHGVPLVDAERWRLKIDGLVDKPLTLKLADLKKLPLHSFHAVLECAGNWRGTQRPQVPGVQWGKGAVGNAEWSGVRLADVLKRAGVKRTAKFVRVEGADEPAVPATPAFVRSIPLDKALEDDTLLAWTMNRQPMPVLHGGPLRLILPRWYGQNWMKWVVHLTLTDSEDKGFYMAKGYRMPKQPVKPGEKWDPATGDPVQQLRVQSLLVSPADHAGVSPGEIVIRGKAFSGAGTITQVEISLDQGESWRNAKLDPPQASGGWQEFEYQATVEKAGPLAIWSRATDSAGKVQPLDQQWNPPGYLGNAVDKIEIEVGKQAVASEETLLGDRCLACHTREMVSTQRLSEEAWEKVVTKMEGFGMKLEAGEKPRLVKYLARWSPSLEKDPPVPTSYWVEEAALESTKFPSGVAARGRGLFAKNCAGCHGKAGEGASAPRLSTRDVPVPYFWAVVGEGKGNMPGFGETLKRQQVADIEAFLRRVPSSR